MTTSEAGELATMAEICELLKVSESTVKRWIKKHGLPGNPGPSGGGWRFSKAEVSAWHEQFKVNA